MVSDSLTVSDTAVAALRQMSRQLQDLITQMNTLSAQLMEDYQQNQHGLGPHSKKIHALLQELEQQCKPTELALTQLILKVDTAAEIRSAMIEDSPYGSDSGNGSGSSPSAVLGRIYDSEYRRRLMPHEKSSDGQHQGSWNGNTFTIGDGFIPGKFNPKGLTFGQLRQQYRDNFGIDYTGTPFVDGYADFSAVSVAQVGLQDIVDANLRKHPEWSDPKNGIDFAAIFSDSGRGRNFGYADEIVAASRPQPRIPGLKPGFTADDLKDWRSEHGFTWDESPDHGYLLVPGFIHGNTSHTGLVGIETHGDDAEANFAARHKPQVTDPF